MSNEAKPNEEEQGGDAGSNPSDGGEFVTKKDFENLQKGVEKLAGKINKSGEGEEGDGGSELPEPKAKVGGINPIVRKIYLKDNKEFLEVEDEVVEEASKLGVDPIEYYEGKKGWQLEAKARADSKKAKEESKNNIESPSGAITKDSSIDFAKVKPEQINKMDKETYSKYQNYLRQTQGEVPISRKS